MILAAALLVLLGLGLFVGGVATGTTALYWATVAVCAVAAVLLIVSRRGLPSSPPARRPADGDATAPRRAPAAPAAPAAPVAEEKGEPPVEDVEVTDLLLVVDLKDEVFVVDEHPRYHLADCPRLSDRTTIPLPLDEARADGFTPCGLCAPDRTTAERERARRAGREP